MRIASNSLGAAIAAFALLALSGCTDKLVGFEATFASDTIAVYADRTNGAQLRFKVPKRTTDLSERTIYLLPHRSILHLNGYLPMTPDRVEDAGDGYVVSMTLPKDLVKLADGALPNTARVHGELTVPCEVGILSFTRTELRVPTAARTLHAGLDAVHAGPMTDLAARIGGFLRGLYAAR